MKVSTDACLQGAWTPVSRNVKNVLDIGCGTGLLSLMLAQRNPGIFIDAIELDAAAVLQAQENVAASPWSDRIKVFQGDARNYPFDKKYDLIICNPPFFNNSLLGDNAQRNQARHSVTLTQEDLFKIIAENITHHGYASVLLPIAEYELWRKLMEKKQWQMKGYMSVKDNADAPVKRVVSCYTPRLCSMIFTQLTIKKADGSYTDDFMDLLRPYYLKL